MAAHYGENVCQSLPLFATLNSQNSIIFIQLGCYYIKQYKPRVKQIKTQRHSANEIEREQNGAQQKKTKQHTENQERKYNAPSP